MFGAKRDGYQGTTVIAEGVRVEGDFSGAGAMVVDGTVVGTLTTDQHVEVGKNARIEAAVKAGSVTVAGHIRGNVTVRDRLELLTGSRLDGDVAAAVLVVAEGAVLNGRCAMGAERGSGGARPKNGNGPGHRPAPATA
jgi:cytoskeletal protein CcmA (bactofilin family)